MRNLPGPASAVAAGSSSVCAVVSGAVWCWGFGANGELGSTDGAARALPSEPVPGLNDARAIGAGAGHYCAVRASGQVVCWGRNDHGQLGDGTRDDRSAPVLVDGLTDVVSVAGGLTHSCAMDSAGHVACWGGNDLGQTGAAGVDVQLAPTIVASVDSAIALAAGDAHTCAVRVDGKVRCWGYGGLDQLGREGRPVAGRAEEVTGLREATSVAAGRDFTCASTITGAVYCWGQSAEGQLGNPGRREPSALPIVLPGLAPVSVVAAGDRTACAASEEAGLSCWGADDVGLLGRGRVLRQPLAARVAGIADVRTITVGAEHACALGSGGVVTCWGGNFGLQLGDGSDHGSSVPRPTAPTASDYRALGAGAAHTCALRGDGALDCWGTNGLYQLGVSAPVVVIAPAVSPSLAGIETFGSGDYHTCARTADALSCWGANESGQLGRGSFSARELPQEISVRATGSIDASGSTTCFVSERSVYCMGDNTFGQLGNDEVRVSATPALVERLRDADVVSVATGAGFTCALLATGRVACWGRNESGQLGMGAVGAPQPTPLEVPDVTAAVGITAGTGHVCAWLADGRAFCWGSNDSGQLGDATFERRATPVEVVGLSGVDLVVGGRDASCARASGQVWCWGSRAWGKLGDGTPLFDAAPALIAGSR